MTIKLALDNRSIDNLDLAVVREQIESWIKTNKLADYEQQLQFEITYEREADDPRELSEIPEIRLWYLRLDSIYPWVPFLLDWKSGELARYVAMLVPHQFNRTEGIIFNPEALELFVMKKIFILSDWLKTQNISEKSRLQSMAKLFGYELDDAFFAMLS